MKRIDIDYGGNHYSIGGRELVDVQAEIAAAMRGDGTAWLQVNSGEGRARPAYLAISQGTAIALSPASDVQPEVAQP